MSAESKPEFIPLEPQTEEERQDWIRKQGKTLYEIFSRGESHWVGPLLGGNRVKSDRFVVRSVRDVAKLALVQLSRTDQEIRDDHVLIGYDPESIESTNPRSDIVTLLHGISDAARESGDASTIHLVSDVIKFSEDPDSVDINSVSTSHNYIGRHLENGGTVFILSGRGSSSKMPDIATSIVLGGNMKPVA